MRDELDNKDPFDEGEEVVDEDLITEGMVKKATYLIHKLAERRGEEFKEIQKKCKKLLKYDNLAKVPISKGHAIIDKLIELTGGEEEEPTRDRPSTPEKEKAKEEPVKKEEEETKTEEDLVTATMRESIRAAVDITLKEVVEKEVPVQGLGGFVLEIGKVIFEAKMTEEAD